MSNMTWKSEIATVCALLVTIIPAVTDLLPPDSKWAGVLGAVLAIVTYVAGWKFEKVAMDKNAKMAAAVAGDPSAPVKPPA